jgi:hypothetical protein
VDPNDFARLRGGLIINLPPASGPVLTSAELLLRDRLVSSAMFSKVEVDATDDPDHLLVAMVRYRPGTSERQVASYLEAIWVTELRLPGLDAFNFRVENRYVEMQAVTGNKEDRYFITLHLIAEEGAAGDFEARHGGVSEPEVKGRRKRWFRG